MSGTQISPSTQPATLIPTSGGTLTDASGNEWTLTSAGAVDENGTPVPNGSDTSAFAIVGNLYYGQDATTQDWYTYSPTTETWTSSAAPNLTSTSTPDAVSDGYSGKLDHTDDRRPAIRSVAAREL